MCNRPFLLAAGHQVSAGKREGPAALAAGPSLVFVEWLGSPLSVVDSVEIIEEEVRIPL